MRRNIYNRKGNVKALLFVFGIILIVSGIIYSQRLVNILKEQSTEYVHFRIKVFESNINNPNFNTDINFLFNEVIQAADYPIIYTDVEGQPQSWKNLDVLVPATTASDLSPADSRTLQEYLQNMAAENDPIPIKYQDSLVLGYYYYGFAPVIYRLRLFPFIAIGAGALFILVGYFGFSYIKKTEQQLIWVGMAKETAHQLGTPLSSIAGWVELMKLDPAVFNDGVQEINNDLLRLNKVASRFSKIGSIPTLKKQDLHSLTQSVVNYFQKRLPNMQKKVILTYHPQMPLPLVAVNSDLFEWVLENLIKNSIDASNEKDPVIEIQLSWRRDKELIVLDVIDNGRGITSQQKKNIFKPGYSTKKRGWGLGLSLARRIIEEYHGGKLFLKESRPGVTTVFRIQLHSTNGTA